MSRGKNSIILCHSLNFFFSIIIHFLSSLRFEFLKRRIVASEGTWGKICSSSGYVFLVYKDKHEMYPENYFVNIYPVISDLTLGQ